MVGGHLFRAICRQPQQDNGHLCGHFSDGPRNMKNGHEARMHVAASTKNAAIHVEAVSGRYSFFAAFIFDVPFFILPVVRLPFSRHGLLSPSNSCTSSFSLPHPLQPPDSPLILRPGFLPPLHSHQSFYLWWIALELPVAFAGPMEQLLRGEKIERAREKACARGGRREREAVNYPVDISARITR